MKLSGRGSRFWILGEMGAERVKYQRQANCRSDPSARTTHKGRDTRLVFSPQLSMNQVRTKSEMQDAWQQPSHSARGRTGAKCLGKSHRPGGDLGMGAGGLLSGDYVA